MNVPNIGQGLGSVTALSRAAGDGDTAEPRSVSGASGESANDSPRIGTDFARLAWFDANGDGRIDPRSSAAGGDATLLVPHSVDPPIYSRNVSQSATSRTVRGTPANAAQTNRAVDAYQRYGQASGGTAAPLARAPVAAPVGASAKSARAVA